MSNNVWGRRQGRGYRWGAVFGALATSSEERTRYLRSSGKGYHALYFGVTLLPECREYSNLAHRRRDVVTSRTGVNKCQKVLPKLSENNG